MMKNISKLLACLAVLGLITVSCSDLEQFNVNDRNISQEQLEVDFQQVGSKYKPIFENIYQYTPAWSYQLQQNLNADVYSGYMTQPRPFVSGSNNSFILFTGIPEQDLFLIFSRILLNIQKPGRMRIRCL